MNKRFDLIIIAFLVLTFFTSCGNSAADDKAASDSNKITNQSNKTANATNTAVVTKRVEPLASPIAIPFDSKINVANFDKLETGMKYADVVKILGSKGEVISEGETAGVKTVMYKWSVAGGAFLKVVFQNGKLVDKAHTGLQ